MLWLNVKRYAIRSFAMSGLFYAGKWLLLDLLSTIFFLVVFSVTNNIYTATGMGIAIGVGQVAYLKLRDRPIDLMQWMSLGLVVVFGGATLLTHNPHFVMVKPTLIYLAVGAVMMKRGWMMRYVPPVAHELGADLIVGFGYVWAGLMFFTAAANLVLALGDPKLWLLFLAVFPAGSKIVLFFIQYATMRVIVGHRHHQAELAQPMAAGAQAA
jgi:intracellular septation protein